MRSPPIHIESLRYPGNGALVLAAAIFGLAAPEGVLAAPTTHTVVIEGMEFSPKVLEVRAGDTVQWINKDPFPHDATSTGKGFKSVAIAPNASWKFVAGRKGSFPYACSIHPMMTARVIVK